MGGRVVLSTFSDYASVFMLMDVGINGGEGGAGGKKGAKGQGGQGGEAGKARKIGTTYETKIHTKNVTIPGDSLSNASIWCASSATYAYVFVLCMCDFMRLLCVCVQI